MLRFQIFGFPVTVHWMFWIVSALLGEAATASSPGALQSVAVWVACVFVSVLWHELGHAFMMRRFGEQQPHILLYGGGGLAMSRAFRTRFEQVLVSLAGPLAGFGLAFLVWLIDRAFPAAPRSLLEGAVVRLLFINIVWSVVNLLPVIPLDGGRITEALLANHRRLALTISLVCGAGLAVFFATRGSMFTTLMFAAMAMDNWRSLQGRATTGWMGHG
ncbi:MAG: M50 family metallopeptidase [Verrucomicrobiaceae bacterium]|nr:M50 family metallopeptidase [Verrucomicrobiaceae bacterium]